jgi:hypothetical protein
MRLQEFPSALPRRQEFIEALIENEALIEKIADGLAACNLDGELILFNHAT